MYDISLTIFVPLRTGSATTEQKERPPLMGALPQDLEKKMSGLLCRGTGDAHLPWGTKLSCPGPTRRECHRAAARKNFLSRDLSGCFHTIVAVATAHRSHLSHPSCCGSCCRLSAGDQCRGAQRPR